MAVNNTNLENSNKSPRLVTALMLVCSLPSFASAAQSGGVQEKNEQAAARSVLEKEGRNDLSIIKLDVLPKDKEVPVAGISVLEIVDASSLAGTKSDSTTSNVVLPNMEGRIETKEVGLEWARFQRELADNTLNGSASPVLADGTVFLSSAMNTALAGYVGKTPAASPWQFKSVDENGYKYAFVGKNQEKWYVSETVFYLDQFPQGFQFHEAKLDIYLAGSEKLVQESIKAPEIFRTIYARQNNGTMVLIKDIDINKLEAHMQAAKESRASEEQDTASVRKFEFTSERTGYVAIVDGNLQDPITAGAAKDAIGLAQMLNALQNPDGTPRYNLVSKNGSECVSIGGASTRVVDQFGNLLPEKSAYQQLNDHVKSMHASGVRSFFINLGGHGNPEGVYFHGRRISPQELCQVFTNFQDSKFVVYTLACHGGGIDNALKNYRDPSGKEGRIFVQLMTKGDSVNQEGRIAGRDNGRGGLEVRSSYYEIFFTKFIETNSYGEAHYLADQAAKRFIGCDAEAWFSGKDGGRKTAGVETPDNIQETVLSTKSFYVMK